MWINILVGVLGFIAGMLCLDFMNDLKTKKKLKKMNEDIDFNEKVRTIIRNWSEIPRIHDKINTLAEALGYEGVNFKENEDGSRELVAWHYAKKKKPKKKKVSQ
jgi:hypothetical protein